MSTPKASSSFLQKSSSSPRSRTPIHFRSQTPPSSRPVTHRFQSSPPAHTHPELALADSPIPHDSPGASGIFVFDSDGRKLAKRLKKRGMTVEEVVEGRIINSNERSCGEFEKMPLEEDEIKKLPKKLRPYYQKLAVIRDHYLEVDSLLSGELPSSIAQSFARPNRAGTPRTYTDLVGNLEDEVAGVEDAIPRWMRRESAWKVRKQHGSMDDAASNGTDEENAGEGTSLLQVEDREARRERVAKLALNINTIVNVLLVAAKAVAVLYSASISLTASLVDSALDLLSTFIILGTSWAIGLKTEKHMYPAGKRRFEPLGVLIFSVAMIASFVQVFIESLQRVLKPGSQEVVDLSAIGIGTMIATIGVKAVLWVWCSRIPSSGVQALAQDAENDVFFNIMSLAFPYIGQLLKWRLLDPIGGMVLSMYIIFEWVKTLLQNFANLSGRSAPADQITRVLYLVSRFNPVLEIGDVECYHIGDDLVVEIDVILPQSSTLHFAHDVGETIQCVLESLDGVIRAYVHTDYSSANPAQHTSRKQPPRLTPTSASGPQPPTPINGSGSTSSKDKSGSITPTSARPLSVPESNGGGIGKDGIHGSPGNLALASPHNL